MTSEPTTGTTVIAVLGAGFSGTLLACHLLRRATQPLRILLIERSGTFGLGLAYGTTDPGHLLNVSAGAMSAWPDDPTHLLRWLERERTALQPLLPDGAEAHTFIPRCVYGRYLQAVLQEAEANVPPWVELRRISDALIDLEPLGPEEPGYLLHFKEHPSEQAQQVVLAWGNSVIPPHHQPERRIRHGWANGAVSGINPDACLLLLGTGLTMVDMVVSLLRQGHRGPLLALSRRGHQPNPHLAVQPIGAWLPADEAPTTTLGLWRLILQRVQQAAMEGYDWRAVIDGLRPVTQPIWEQLPPDERRRFLRHVAVVWDVHRHRIAPALYRQLRQSMADGQLQFIAGRLISSQADSGGLHLQIRRRGQTLTEEITVDQLIQCTGIPSSHATSSQPLLNNLHERLLLQSDPLQLGTECDQNGQLLTEDGAGIPGIYTLGSPRKGQLWESIAVPELRHQVRDLAQVLLNGHDNLLREPQDPPATEGETVDPFIGMFI